jgi:hypothetical protein
LFSTWWDWFVLGFLTALTEDGRPSIEIIILRPDYRENSKIVLDKIAHGPLNISNAVEENEIAISFYSQIVRPNETARTDSL